MPKLHIEVTEEASKALEEVQELVAKKEMIKVCTQAHAVTKAIILLKDKLESEGIV